jgi:hypothetical protein
MVGSAKLRPEFAKYKAKDPKTGEKAAPGGLSRLANILFVTALGEAHLDILDQKTTNTLKGAKYSTSSTRIGQGLKELAPKAFEELFREKNPRSVEVSEYVNDPEKLEELIKDTVINYTRRDREYIKDIETEDIADAVEDAVDDISDEVKIAQGLMSSGADQVELDFDDLDVNIEALDNKEEVAAKIVELINTTNNLKAEVTPIGFNVEGPVGIFRAKKDARGNIIHTGEEVARDQMNRLITKYFPAVREAEIKVTLNTDQEEDYEEGPEPMEPEVNEYEEDINDAEDEESNIKFSVGSVGGQHGQIMHTDKTFDSLEDACDHAGIDVRDCISGEWDDMGDGTKEYVVDEDTVIIMHDVEEDAEYKFNPRRDAPEHSEGDPHPAQRAAESIIGAEVMWDGMMKSGRVDEVDVENGVAVVVDEDGGEHIVQLGDFDVVNPVEDNEFDDFDIGPQSDENIPDDYEEVLKAMVTKDKEEFAKNMIEDEEGDTETHKLLRMAEDILGNLEDSGHRELAARGISGVDDDYDDDAIDMLYNLIDQGWTRGSNAFRLARKIVDFGRRGLEEDEESILSKIEQDISNGMTVKESMDSLGIHPSHQKDMLHKYLAYTKEYSEGPVETGFEDEEGGMRLKELEIGGHRYEVGVDDPHDDGIVIDIEKNKNGYTITGAVYSDPMDYYEDPNDMKEGYRYGIDQDGKYIGAPGGVGRIDETIKMQPHLEVSETSTAAYLTEQKQSDKRNKKAEVKNQSFKEKYKPKTHWQLEELRRYGL